MTAEALYPPLPAREAGTLQVSALHRIAYEEAGRADGFPVVHLHGGPGAGVEPGQRRFYDPGFFRIVLPDQRGAGRSEPAGELRNNTTDRLVEDLERLRTHLRIERWLLSGGSWGSTLALAYAARHPQRVRGLLLRGVFLGRPAEIAWVHGPEGAARLEPEAWARYVAAVPVARRDDLLGAYAELLDAPDPAIREAAARAWCRWESTLETVRPDPDAVEAWLLDARRPLALARIECHYMRHGCFLPHPDHLLRQAPRLTGIPCSIVHGRLDRICPLRTAEELHRALPASTLDVVPDGGHSPAEPAMSSALVRSADAFRDRVRSEPT